MYNNVLVLLSKILIKFLRLIGKNGSALPGLIIERLSPQFLQKTLVSVEKRIVLVTGTNGKTTTTKMLVAGLRGAGSTVVTNSTGSNMTRGLIAALVEDMTFFGSLRPTDWFVFEMDEAYGPIFTQNISPHLVVGLNVLRDQLDRYGEIDATAQLIQKTASKADVYIYNNEDPLLRKSCRSLESNGDVRAVSFGVTQSLRKRIIDEEVISGFASEESHSVGSKFELCKITDQPDFQHILILHGDKNVSVRLPAKGFHNAFNLTAVVASLDTLEVSSMQNSMDAIEKMPIPFGRGEKLHLRDKLITVGLVKNPSGFISNIETFVEALRPELLLFVVNDKLADGRDVSWLWDVPFEGRIDRSTKVLTSGIRGYDMAVRLKHDGIRSDTVISTTEAIEQVMNSKYSNIVIIPTYTALFDVRAALAKYGKVPRIW